MSVVDQEINIKHRNDCRSDEDPHRRNESTEKKQRLIGCMKPRNSSWNQWDQKKKSSTERVRLKRERERESGKAKQLFSFESFSQVNFFFGSNGYAVFLRASKKG